MESNPSEPNIQAHLSKLYPHLTPEERKIAEENLRQYVALTVRMYGRIRNDPAAHSQFRALTERDE